MVAQNPSPLTFTIWCLEWDDRGSFYGTFTKPLGAETGPEYNYDGGRVLSGLDELVTALKATNYQRRPISRLEIRRDRQTVATFTRD
jgi:hypothetical protein